MTFGQIHIPEGADQALEWAATREFELRFKRAERQRIGVNGTIVRATGSMERFRLTLAGDPSVPEIANMRVVDKETGEDVTDQYVAGPAFPPEKS